MSKITLKLDRCASKIEGYLQLKIVSKEVSDEIGLFEDLLDVLPDELDESVKNEYKQKWKIFVKCFQWVQAEKMDILESDFYPRWDGKLETVEQFLTDVNDKILDRVDLKEDDKRTYLNDALPPPLNLIAFELDLVTIKTCLISLQTNIIPEMPKIIEHFEKDVILNDLFDKLTERLESKETNENSDELEYDISYLELLKSCLKQSCEQETLIGLYRFLELLNQWITRNIVIFNLIVVECLVLTNKLEQPLMDKIEQSTSKLAKYSRKYRTNWIEHQNLCALIITSLKQMHENGAHLKAVNQTKVKDYLLGLLDVCEHEHEIPTVVSTLMQLSDASFGEHLFEMLCCCNDLFDRSLTLTLHKNNLDQKNHFKMCIILKTLTKSNCGKTIEFLQMNNPTVVDYLIKVIEQYDCQEDQTIPCAITALCTFSSVAKHTPFDCPSNTLSFRELAVSLLGMHERKICKKVIIQLKQKKSTLIKCTCDFY